MRLPYDKISINAVPSYVVPWFVLLSKLCHCYWEECGTLSLDLHANHLYLVFRNFPIHLFVFNTIAAKLTSFFFPLHQKNLFIKSSPLPQFQWQQTIFHFPPSVGFVFVLNPAECATSVDLLPLVFHCFSKRIFSLWVEFYFLCCIIVQSWLIISSNAIFIIMKIFTVWILACVIPASYYFFDECLEEISVGLLWEKRK